MASQYKINLALQGGGAHGAFTWGVLDRLLEEEDIQITGISGTSAGAMNGVVLIDGYMKNGRQGARDNLQRFWYKVGELGVSCPLFTNSPYTNFNFLDALTKTFSPYQLNPFNLNPLKNILEDVLDTSLINSCSIIRLFVTATSVKTGQPRVFECKDITLDAILASACLPQLFQAVKIDGEDYWDGGYMGNPAIWPLIYNTDVDDILLVQINPTKRAETPKTAQDIINRVNEITFNSSLIAEMRAINFVAKLVAEGKLDDKEYKSLRMHMVEAHTELRGLDASTKMETSVSFFESLKKAGRSSMSRWLAKNKSQIGIRGTLDIEKVFLAK